MALVEGPQTLQGNITALQDALVNIAVAFWSRWLAARRYFVLLHLAVSGLTPGARAKHGENIKPKKQLDSESLIRTRLYVHTAS